MNEPPLHPLRIPTGWTISYNDFRGGDPDDPAASEWLFREDLFQASRESPDKRVVDLGWYGEREDGFFKICCVEPDFLGVELEAIATRSPTLAARELERMLEAATHPKYVPNAEWPTDLHALSYAPSLTGGSTRTPT